MQFPNPLDLTARACRFGLEYRAEAKATRAASYLCKEAIRREFHVIGKAISGLKRPVTQQDTDAVVSQYDAQYPRPTAVYEDGSNASEKLDELLEPTA